MEYNKTIPIAEAYALLVFLLSSQHYEIILQRSILSIPILNQNEYYGSIMIFEENKKKKLLQLANFRVFDKIGLNMSRNYVYKLID